MSKFEKICKILLKNKMIFGHSKSHFSYNRKTGSSLYKETYTELTEKPQSEQLLIFGLQLWTIWKMRFSQKPRTATI